MLPSWYYAFGGVVWNITTPDFRIELTPDGWIDDRTALQWLIPFHEAIRYGTKCLSMIDVFECNETNGDV